MKKFLKNIFSRELLMQWKGVYNYVTLHNGYGRGFRFSQSYQQEKIDKSSTLNKENPLKKYFDNHTKGRGIWKWEHYFDVYHKHFSKFVGKNVNIAEIGIYSGGSLEMWASYFGEDCKVIGIDIEEDCKAYESRNISIHIGDQEDRQFWKKFRLDEPNLDIVVDDGGHTPEQQIVTLEETLPHLRPGGVFVCEDISGVHNKFTKYACGLVAELNMKVWETNAVNPSTFQKAIHSIHFYPYMVVIEKHEVQPEGFIAPKHGTEWQPFFD